MCSSPAATEDVVIFGGRGRRLYALDAKTGKERWTFMAKRGIDSSPVIVGDRVYFGSDDGYLYAANLATGDKIWEYEAGGLLGRLARHRRRKAGDCQQPRQHFLLRRKEMIDESYC